jgi:hypothetical protein
MRELLPTGPDEARVRVESSRSVVFAAGQEGDGIAIDCMWTP